MQLSSPRGSHSVGGDEPSPRQPLWSRRSVPTTAAGAPEWMWALNAPADITAARQQLRTAVVVDTLPPGAAPDDVERLLLTFEELASNGLRHGRSPVHVRVSRTAEGWLIDVTDSALDRAPEPAVGRDPAFGGLGLYLVARLFAAHGWMIQCDRKHVWACVRPA